MSNDAGNTCDYNSAGVCIPDDASGSDRLCVNKSPPQETCNFLDSSNNNACEDLCTQAYGRAKFKNFECSNPPPPPGEFCASQSKQDCINGNTCSYDTTTNLCIELDCSVFSEAQCGDAFGGRKCIFKNSQCTDLDAFCRNSKSTQATCDGAGSCVWDSGASTCRALPCGDNACSANNQYTCSDQTVCKTNAADCCQGTNCETRHVVVSNDQCATDATDAPTVPGQTHAPTVTPPDPCVGLPLRDCDVSATCVACGGSDPTACEPIGTDVSKFTQCLRSEQVCPPLTSSGENACINPLLRNKCKFFNNVCMSNEHFCATEKSDEESCGKSGTCHYTLNDECVPMTCDTTNRCSLREPTPMYTCTYTQGSQTDAACKLALGKGNGGCEEPTGSCCLTGLNYPQGGGAQYFNYQCLAEITDTPTQSPTAPTAPTPATHTPTQTPTNPPTLLPTAAPTIDTCVGKDLESCDLDTSCLVCGGSLANTCYPIANDYTQFTHCMMAETVCSSDYPDTLDCNEFSRGKCKLNLQTDKCEATTRFCSEYDSDMMNCAASATCYYDTTTLTCVPMTCDVSNRCSVRDPAKVTCTYSLEPGGDKVCKEGVQRLTGFCPHASCCLVDNDIAGGGGAVYHDFACLHADGVAPTPPPTTAQPTIDATHGCSLITNHAQCDATPNCQVWADTFNGDFAATCVPDCNNYANAVNTCANVHGKQCWVQQSRPNVCLPKCETLMTEASCTTLGNGGEAPCRWYGVTGQCETNCLADIYQGDPRNCIDEEVSPYYIGNKGEYELTEQKHNVCLRMHDDFLPAGEIYCIRPCDRYSGRVACDAAVVTNRVTAMCKWGGVDDPNCYEKCKDLTETCGSGIQDVCCDSLDRCEYTDQCREKT